MSWDFETKILAMLQVPVWTGNSAMSDLPVSVDTVPSRSTPLARAQHGPRDGRNSRAWPVLLFCCLTEQVAAQSWSRRWKRLLRPQKPTGGQTQLLGRGENWENNCCNECEMETITHRFLLPRSIRCCCWMDEWRGMGKHGTDKKRQCKRHHSCYGCSWV
jgi:hypothetical protein